MKGPFYVLFEHAAGYALFQRIEGDEIGDQQESFQQDLIDFSKFNKIVKLTSFMHFTSSEQALENIRDVAEGFFWTKKKICQQRSSSFIFVQKKNTCWNN